MGKITEQNVWNEEIYSLELEDPVVGGAPEFVGNIPVVGFANAAVQQLSNRTLYLRINLETVRQIAEAAGGGHVGYATEADMLADTTQPEKTIAEVFSDPDPEKNGTYLRTGGVWVKQTNPFDWILRDLQGGRYLTEESGRLASVDNQMFTVSGKGMIDAYEYRRVSATESELIGVLPTIEVAQAFAEAWSKESVSRAPLLSFNDEGGYFIIDPEGVEVDGPRAILALRTEISKANYVRAPYQNFDSTGDDIVEVDQNGNVVGGPTLLNNLKNKVYDNSYRRAPFESFDDTEDSKVELDSDGNVVGGVEVTKLLNDKIEAIEGQIETLESSFTEESKNPVRVEGSVLTQLTESGEEVYVDITPETFNTNYVPYYRGKAVIAAINRATLSTTTPVAIGMKDEWVKFPVILPSGRKLMIVIIGFGQSNSVGSQGYEPVNVLTVNKYKDTLLMPAGTGFMDVRFGLPSGSESVGAETVLDPDTIIGFKPLVALQSQLLPSQGATMMEGIGYAFADAVYKGLDIKPMMCLATAGWGGRVQADLAKGTIPYQNFMTALTKIKQLANEEGYEVWVPFVPIVHGESDSTRPEYIEGIKTWQVDFNTDIKAITGQDSDVPFLCTQASTFQGGASINGVLAPYLASEDATTHHLATPYYPYPLAPDNLHLGKSGPIVGEKMAHAAARILGIFGANKYGTPRPISVTYDGANTIDVEFFVPSPPLVRDTTDLTVNSPSPADWGFRIRSGGGSAVPITSITITSPTTVRIVTSAPVTAGGFRSVDYAMVGFGSPKVTGMQARGQLRDSESIPSIVTGQPLYNWMPHFRELF